MLVSRGLLFGSAYIRGGAIFLILQYLRLDHPYTLNQMKVNCYIKFFKIDKIYREIPNISPGLIEVRRPLLGGLYSGGGLYLGELILGGNFVLVSEYKDLKIHCYI